MKKFIEKIMKIFSSVALCTAVISANTTCPWIIHQPEVPEEIKNLKKLNKL